jgi:hypothetical protein
MEGQEGLTAAGAPALTMRVAHDGAASTGAYHDHSHQHQCEGDSDDGYGQLVQSARQRVC